MSKQSIAFLKTQNFTLFFVNKTNLNRQNKNYLDKIN